MTIARFENIERKIITLRGENTIIDSDVADLYGVFTKEINQAVKNNPDKFPDEYIIELTKIEKSELVKNFDRFASLRHSTVLPKAFTERGPYMWFLKSSEKNNNNLANMLI